MTKNLIELSKRVLGKFRGQNGEPVSGRFSQPVDFQTEKTALTNLEFGAVWKSPSGVKVCDYRLDGSRYIALALTLPDEELNNLEVTGDGSIKLTEVVGSIYLLLADKLSLTSRENDSLWIDEYIAGPALTDEGVELDVVKNCLDDLVVFQIHDNSLLRGEVPARYVANYICTFDARFSKNKRLNQVSFEIIREMFLRERYYLIEGNFFAAMSAPSARYAFLEIYRTLEFVFVLPRAHALLNALRSVGGKIDLNVIDFARYCNRELGWKRVERDAIERIFKEFFKESRGAYEELVKNCTPFNYFDPIPEIESKEKDVSNFLKKVADRYYNLRNQIAHQFWPDDEVDCGDADFYVLIDFSLRCIQCLYDQHLSAPVLNDEL